MCKSSPLRNKSVLRSLWRPYRPAASSRTNVLRRSVKEKSPRMVMLSSTATTAQGQGRSRLVWSDYCLRCPRARRDRHAQSSATAAVQKESTRCERVAAALTTQGSQRASQALSHGPPRRCLLDRRVRDDPALGPRASTDPRATRRPSAPSLPRTALLPACLNRPAPVHLHPRGRSPLAPQCHSERAPAPERRSRPRRDHHRRLPRAQGQRRLPRRGRAAREEFLHGDAAVDRLARERRGLPREKQGAGVGGQRGAHQGAHAVGREAQPEDLHPQHPEDLGAVQLRFDAQLVPATQPRNGSLSLPAQATFAAI